MQPSKSLLLARVAYLQASSATPSPILGKQRPPLCCRLLTHVWWPLSNPKRKETTDPWLHSHWSLNASPGPAHQSGGQGSQSKWRTSWPSASLVPKIDQCPKNHLCQPHFLLVHGKGLPLICLSWTGKSTSLSQTITPDGLKSRNSAIKLPKLLFKHSRNSSPFTAFQIQ